MALAMVFVLLFFVFKSIIKSSLLEIKRLGRNSRVWDSHKIPQSKGKGWTEHWAE